MIEMYLLEQLAAIRRCGTLSAASRELHISQPSISRAMQKLEQTLGVPLFARQKNRVALNEAGELAARSAARILRLEKEMTENLRALERRRRTVSFGCCAPVPLHDFLPRLAAHFSGMRIVSELAGDSALESGLRSGLYDIVVLHAPLKGAGLYTEACGAESLFLSLPPSHPLAGRRGLRLRELDGESLLLYEKLGFWYDLCREKMPAARFLMQSDRGVFKELVGASALPAFTTDVMIRRGGAQKTRVHIPVLDRDAKAVYRAACKAEAKDRFGAFLRLMAAHPVA